MTSPLLDSLNPAQQDAATHLLGPLLILAGPGSGKTRVITHRIGHLIQEHDVRPYRILAVTFTNKAAREMKDRLRALIGPAADDVTMGTFHSVCVRMLRADAERAGLDRRFVIYDDDDQMGVIKQAVEALAIDTKRFAPRAIHSAIGQAKSQLIAPEDYPARDYFGEVVRRVYWQYQDALQECRALDFDDIILRTVGLLRESQEVREKYQERYLHVLIDEFQDTNVAQYVWAMILAEKHHNICVVGDPDQSIYSWRSADIRNILNFEQDYPDARVVLLQENYRSTKTILEAAGQVIRPNRQRKEVSLWTRNQPGVPIVYREGYDEEDEARHIVDELEQLVKRDRYGWGSCAVMYRTNAQSRALEEAMVRRGMPYKLVGATRFYERREVKDLLAYFRLLQNPFDNASMQRVINVPPRGIGAKTVEALARFASRTGVPWYTALQLVSGPESLVSSQERDGPETGDQRPETPQFNARTLAALGRFLGLLDELTRVSESEALPDLFDGLLARLEYKAYLSDAFDDGDERWENVQELRGVAERSADLNPLGGLESFLEGVALVSDVDNLEEGPEAVTLITLHQAKGLEFPVVFICGLEEGVLPHSRSFDNPAQLEEERRLAYVGVTRAKERLYLTRAFRRNTMGGWKASLPSRFLRDLPDHLLEAPIPKQPVDHRRLAVPEAWLPGPRQQGASSRQPEAVQGASFRTGEKVRHKQFGEGIVVSCEPTRSDQVVTVAFKGGVGIKRLSLSIAPLERA